MWNISYKFSNHISIKHMSSSLINLKEIMDYLNLLKSAGNLKHKQV